MLGGELRNVIVCKLSVKFDDFQLNTSNTKEIDAFSNTCYDI